MKLILILVLLGFSAASYADTNPDKPTVLVVGDSISAAYGLNEADGWVRLAEKELQQSYPDIELINASISGDTTEGALRRLPAALDRFDPTVLIIELGGNDGLRGYSLKKLRENLETLTRMGQQAGAEVLLLGMQIPSNYGPAYTEKFAKTFVDAANATNAALVPFFLEPIALDTGFFLPDGIHPNAEAQPLLLPPVLEQLQLLLKKVVPTQ